MRRVFFVAALIIVSSAGSATVELTGRAVGDPKAPIRIDLYSDFQCPGCKMLHEETIRPLINEFVKTGRVYLVQHEFPLVNIHPHAHEAACYACAAESVGKYQAVCDRLFRTQQQWVKDGNVDAAACSALTAAEATKVRAMVKTKEVSDYIAKDVKSAETDGVNSTPTMIITKSFRKYPLTGPVHYPVLKTFLDSLR